MPFSRTSVGVDDKLLLLKKRTVGTLIRVVLRCLCKCVVFFSGVYKGSVVA